MTSERPRITKHPYKEKRYGALSFRVWEAICLRSRNPTGEDKMKGRSVYVFRIRSPALDGAALMNRQGRRDTQYAMCW